MQVFRGSNSEVTDYYNYYIYGQFYNPVHNICKLPNQTIHASRPSSLGFWGNTRHTRDFQDGFYKFLDLNMNIKHITAKFLSLWYWLGSLLKQDGELWNCPHVPCSDVLCVLTGRKCSSRRSSEVKWVKMSIRSREKLVNIWVLFTGRKCIVERLVKLRKHWDGQI